MSGWSPGSAQVGDRAQWRAAARQVLDDQWRAPGFTCPNATTYPWLWLWDSCFHSVVWAELGDAARATSELALALGGQGPSGFVPHLQYLDGSNTHDGFWGRPATSSITQPPIYGWTVAELHRRGIPVEREVVERAGAGLRFLFERRRRSSAGLIEIVHPWESGCDHSPRWDDLMRAPGVTGLDPYDEAQWFRRKGELVASVHHDASGAPLWNDEFPVGSVAFSAMTAFCARELASVTEDAALARDLRRHADDVVDALRERWEPGRRTWIDDGPTATGSGRIRTAEVLLALLVDQRDEVVQAVVDELGDRDAFGGEFGPSQVHRGEPTYRAGSYWRGPSWPQLDLLLWIALHRVGRSDAAADLAAGTVRGAVGSGWSEYWDADTGAGGGAAPQSWTTVAVLLAGDGPGWDGTA
jgi:hypothetical protein